MTTVEASPQGAGAGTRTEAGAMVSEGALRLVIGVTGHRDFRGVSAEVLRQRVREEFRELQAKYPRTPLVVLSPLNAGADRLVAGAARDEGLRVIAVLPWPQGTCDELLHRSGERSDFDVVLAEADDIIRLPLLPDTSADQLRDQEAIRERHYAQVGAYIARHGQMLLALWDGIERDDSGTANVVRWAREGTIAPFAPQVGLLDSVESGPVIQLVLPERGAAARDAKVARRVIAPAGFDSEREAEAYFHGLWSRTDEFNADIGQGQTTEPGAAEASREGVLPAGMRGSLEAPLRQLLTHYAAADCAATRFQSLTRYSTWMTFGLVGLAIVAFEFYAHLYPDQLWLLALYLLLLLFGAGLVWWARRGRIQAKHIDYRALAEALRIQFFWRLAGRTECVTDHYLRTFRSELDWIRQAARSCHLTCGGHSTAAPGSPVQADRLRWVREHWVLEQATYFSGRRNQVTGGHHSGKAHREERRHHRFELVGMVCFVAALVLAGALLFVHWKTQHPSHLLVVIVFLAAAGAALIHEFAELSGCAADATRYKWAGALFRTAEDRLRNVLSQGNAELAGQVVVELGREALAENADWVRQRRLKPLKTPAPA